MREEDEIRISKTRALCRTILEILVMEGLPLSNELNIHRMFFKMKQQLPVLFKYLLFTEESGDSISWLVDEVISTYQLVETFHEKDKERNLEKQLLQSEIGELDRLIKNTDPAEVINLVSLKSRREQVIQELKKYEESK